MKKIIMMTLISVLLSLTSCRDYCFCEVLRYHEDINGSGEGYQYLRPYSDDCSDDGTVLSPTEIVRCD